MNDLKINGYRTVVPGSVWDRQSATIEHPLTSEQVPATEVLCMGRYRTPKSEEIIEMIKRAAVKYCLGTPVLDEQQSLIVKMIETLPPSERKNVAGGNKDSIEHLKRHYSLNEREEGSLYLEFKSGCLPTEILESAREIMEEGSEDYNFILQNAPFKSWGARIKLEESAGGILLPPRKDLEFLLEKNVESSKILKIAGDYDNFETAGKLIGTIYDCLGALGTVEKITDYSEGMALKRAASTINETAMCFAARAIASGLPKNLFKILADAGIKVIGGDDAEEEKKKRFGFGPSDCNLN